jgi:ABC-2 type transport system ATP-binding protein
METLKLIHCTKSFDDKRVLNDLTWSFQPGVYYITGHNGEGKSTLLKMCMGLLLPDEGSVQILGEDTTHLSKNVKKKIGYVFASDRTLYYKLTARENLDMICSIYGIKKKERTMVTQEVLKSVGLQDEQKYIETYSTGMKKRLMFGRAMVYDPEIIFLDEPLSGLDPEGYELILNLIEKMEEQGKTVIMVTHQTDDMKKDWKHLQLSKGKLCGGM